MGLGEASAERRRFALWHEFQRCAIDCETYFPIKKAESLLQLFQRIAGFTLAGSCADCATGKLCVGHAPRVTAHYLRSLCCKIAAEGDWA